MARWTLYLSEFNIQLVHIPGKRNIQADTLSRRLDLCPEGTDNKNIIVLPEHLFANLIDTELQRRIANTRNMDYDTAEAIKGLLGEGPNKAKRIWKIGKWKNLKGGTYCSIKRRTTFQTTANFDIILYRNIMIIQQPDTQGSFKHLMQSKSIIGGQIYESLSKTMSKVVEHVNNSR